MKYIKHTPTAKDLKIWIALFVLIILIPILGGYYLEPNNPIVLIAVFIIAGFFIFNFVIRKSLSFKDYFTSDYNPFTSKVRYEKTFDISKELMFEKIVEVINDSEFKLVAADDDKYKLLATTNITFKSWGENLYISFETKNNDTLMKFCSVTFFQMSSWGKNEKNYNNLLNKIESSLTI